MQTPECYNLDAGCPLPLHTKTLRGEIVDQKELLFRLQEIDITWDKVRQRLVKLQKFSGGSPSLLKAREQVAATEAELHHWRGEQNDAELEAQALSQRIKDTEDRLMSGQVQNPKELQSLQASVEAMRRQRVSVEDRSVEALMKAEELAVRLQEQQEKLDRMETEWESKQAAIEEELEKRKQEYVYLKQLRAQVVAAIDADMLEQYEYLRQRKNGIAVAQLQEDACSACFMQVPTSVVSAVRRGEDLTYCPSCGRLLFSP